MYTSRQNNSALGFRAEEAKQLQIHFAGKGFLIAIVMALVIAFVIAFVTDQTARQTPAPPALPLLKF